MLTRLVTDIRYSARGLAKRPMFAALVVTTLAFGIGVNVAVFSVFEQLLLRPLPVSEPDGLVNLAAPGPKQGSNSCNQAGDCDSVLSYPMFRDIERVQESFIGVAAHRSVDANLSFDGQTLSGEGVLVSGAYFALLGLQPTLGRLLGPQDDNVDGEAESVVLSYYYWQNNLGGDSSVLGSVLVVNGKPLTIVGIAPSGFSGTTLGVQPDVFLPITFRWLDQPRSIPNHDDRRNYWVYSFARLKPGISREQAQAAIDPAYRAILNEVEAPLQTGMSEQTLEAFRRKALTLAPGARGQSSARGVARTPMTILLAATGIVLLIACVNVANLMLARGSTREGEMAVRLSMGADARRLGAMLVTESLLLAVMAALVSLPLTLGVLRWIMTMLPPEGTGALDFGLNLQVVGISVAAALVVFALAPVLKLARTEAGQVLQSQGVRSIGGKAARRFRVALATSQIALSMMLLVLAGLFTQSLANITRVDLGIRTESLLSFQVSPALNGYTSTRAAILFDRIEEDLAALPGVTAVASSMLTLLSGSNVGNNVSVEGYENPSLPGANNSAMNWIGSGFFRALDIPMLAGRDFTAADALDRPKVAIVNERFAEHFGLGRDAVGKRFSIGDGTVAPDIEIVGVARDAKYSEVKDDIDPQLFLPRRQSDTIGFMSFYVRVAGGAGDEAAAEQLMPAIRQSMARIDPNLPVTNLRTVNQQVRENVFLDRFVTTLAAGLAVLATLLAAIGLYGVLSYMVAQRTREIGLRLALGAPPATVRGMVLRQVVRMGTIGGGVGLGAALILAQAAGALLFGLSPADPRILLAATVVLTSVVLAAGYLPARRASRVDPIIALRYE